MSGSRPTVGIRISAEGADLARAKIEAVGTSGEAAMRRVATASALAGPEMQKLGTSVDVLQRTFIGMGGSLGRVGSVATGVSAVAGTLVTGFLALGAAAATAGVGIAKAGDEASATLARLTSATGGLAQAEQVYGRLFALSQQTGIAVSESAGSFARFSVAAKEIGATSDQVLRLTAGIQKAGIVAGASAQETGAAVQQIGQALASGKLQGDELRSLLENLPQLAQALGRELGYSVGQLRQMGSEGKLTAETVFPALLRASEKMGAEFDRLPVTMSRAKDILIAATEDFGQRLDRITGLSRAFAGFMQQGAAALRSAGAAIAPTDREAADQGVAAAERRAAEVRARIGVPATDEQINASYRFEADRARLRAQRDEDAKAILLADQELSQALARQNEIRRGDRELQRAEAVDAAQQAAEARRTRLGVEVRDVVESLDKRLKINREYAEKLKLINDSEAASLVRLQGSPGVEGARFEADRARTLLMKDRVEALKKLAEEESRGGEEAKKAAEKRQNVIDKLDAQVAAATRASAATMSGAASSREMALALEVEAKLNEAGIPAIEKRTEAEKKAAAIIDARVRSLDKIKEAEKKYLEETKKTKEFQEKSWNDLAGIGERAFERLGDAIVNAFTSGNGAAINFGNVAKAILGSVVTDIAKLAVINPILNSLFTSSSGPRSTLTAALGSGGAGSSGGIGNIFGNLGSTLSSGWNTLSSGGYLAGGGGFSEALFGAAPTAQSFSDLGGITANVGGTSGLIGSGGSFSLGALGSTLGGIGAGFGIGSTIGGFIANSQAQRQNSQIGSALGSLIGSIGGPLGSIIGGTLGGGLGGLIGPKDSVHAYGLRLQSAGFVENGANDFAGSLVPVSRQYYDEAGAAQFQQADALVAAVNAYLSANGLQVAGASIIGGNRNGPDGSGFGTVGEAFANLAFRSTDNAKLSAYLGTQTFDDPAKLQAAVDGFKQAEAAIKALGADAVPAFTASLKAINDNFDAGVEAARKYGLAEDTLTTARAKALAALEAQRTETLRASDVALAIRRSVAGGDSQTADLARQAEAARQEIDSFTKSLDALAVSAEDKAARLVNLEEVQAAERLAIIQRYGEQAATALRQAGSNIRGYLDGLATGSAAGASPTDRLTAAQAAFERDRLLATGGDRDALGRITSSADALLSAGRDVYASGAGFQGIKSGVVSGLTNLPVVQSYDAMQTASLAAIQAALTTGTLNTATTILTSGNTVQIAGGVSSAGVESRLGLLIEQAQTAAAARVALHATTIQGVEVLGGMATNLANGRVTAINQEAALYALGLIGNATNDNLGLLQRIGVDASAAEIAALNASNTIAASNANAFVAAMNANNVITADGNRILGAINSYASFIDNTTRAEVNHQLEVRDEIRGLRQQVNELKAALATLNTTFQQGATLTATETRAAGTLVASRVEAVDDTLRKNAA